MLFAEKKTPLVIVEFAAKEKTYMLLISILVFVCEAYSFSDSGIC